MSSLSRIRTCAIVVLVFGVSVIVYSLGRLHTLMQIIGLSEVAPADSSLYREVTGLTVASLIGLGIVSFSGYLFYLTRSPKGNHMT